MTSLLTLNFEDIFPDDAIMNFYDKSITKDEEVLAFHGNADAFEFGNWWSVPVVTCTKNCTDLENCTENCTHTVYRLHLANILYKNTELLTSKQLFEIGCLDIYGTNATEFSTGNASKNLHVDSCYMADTIYANPKPGSKKRGREEFHNSTSNKNLTPFTIMVVDTIGTIKSGKLSKVLLDSGSITTLINKRCLPKQCKPCQITQSKTVTTQAGSYQSSAMVIMRK